MVCLHGLGLSPGVNLWRQLAIIGVIIGVIHGLGVESVWLLVLAFLLVLARCLHCACTFNSACKFTTREGAHALGVLLQARFVQAGSGQDAHPSERFFPLRQ